MKRSTRAGPAELASTRLHDKPDASLDAVIPAVVVLVVHQAQRTYLGSDRNRIVAETLTERRFGAGSAAFGSTVVRPIRG